MTDHTDDQHSDAVVDRQEPAIPLWYRTAAAISWRFLVIVAAAGAVIY